MPQENRGAAVDVLKAAPDVGRDLPLDGLLASRQPHAASREAKVQVRARDPKTGEGIAHEREVEEGPVVGHDALRRRERVEEVVGAPAGDMDVVLAAELVADERKDVVVAAEASRLDVEEEDALAILQPPPGRPAPLLRRGAGTRPRSRTLAERSRVRVRVGQEAGLRKHVVGPYSGPSVR